MSSYERPEPLGAELRAGLLAPVLTEFCDADTGIYALYPHSRHVSPKVRAFVDFLAARFGPTPPWDAGLRPAPGGASAT